VLDKQQELDKVRAEIQNEYLPIVEHEQIVNDLMTSTKQEQAKEIEKLCDQFEQEFIAAQEENDQEKEIIRREFKEKICQHEHELNQLREEYDDTKQEYQKAADALRNHEENETLMRQKISETENKLDEFEFQKRNDLKDLQDSMYRLNKELSIKSNQINQLELDKEKMQKQKKDVEETHKHNTSMLERKLKDVTSANENKVKHTVSQNVNLQQRILTLEEDLKSIRTESSQKNEETDQIIMKYDELSQQHECLAKDSEDREDYLHMLEAKLHKLTHSKTKISKAIIKEVASKCKQMKEELEFVKKCHSDEVALMGRHLENTYSELLSYTKDMTFRLTNECTSKVQEAKRQAEEKAIQQVEQAREQFNKQLQSLHERCEEGEQNYSAVEQDLSDAKQSAQGLKRQIDDLKSILSIKDLSISKLQTKLQVIDKEIDKFYDQFSKHAEVDVDQDVDSDSALLEITTKILRIKNLSTSVISRLKNNMDKSQSDHCEEVIKIKAEYQQKIDGLFEESYKNVQKLSEADGELEVTSQKLKSLTQQVNQAKVVLKNISNVTDEASVLDSAQQVAFKFHENTELLEKFKHLSEEKETQLEGICKKFKTTRDESLHREAKMKDQLNKSREELHFRTHQIAATEQILKQSKDLLSKYHE